MLDEGPERVPVEVDGGAEISHGDGDVVDLSKQAVVGRRPGFGVGDAHWSSLLSVRRTHGLSHGGGTT